MDSLIVENLTDERQTENHRLKITRLSVHLVMLLLLLRLLLGLLLRLLLLMVVVMEMMMLMYIFRAMRRRNHSSDMHTLINE